MMIDLIFLDVKKNARCKKEVKKLYHEAFPRNESAPFSVLTFFAKKRKAKFCGIYDKDTFVGLVYNIYYRDIVYIYYLAIEKELRGKGYGSRVLETLKQKYRERRIILMMEEMDENSDNYEERVKRQKFYHNSGFIDLNYKVKEAKVVYEMLEADNVKRQVSRGEYMDLMRNFWGEILYKYVYEKIICR